MKKIFTLPISILLCASSALAAGIGDKIAATNVLSEKLLETISFDANSSSTFVYNESNQLVRILSKDYGDTETTTFDYAGGTIDGIDYDVKMTIRGEETSSLYITVGDNLFAASVYQVSDYGTSTWAFEYDNDGHLVKMTRSEGEEVTEITYEDGDITQVMVSDDEGTYTHTITYGGDIENHSRLMIYDMTFGFDMDEMAVAYLAGLLGTPTKHLPTLLTYDDGDTETYTWTIDADGFPTSLRSVYEDYPITVSFTWIDCAGIQVVNSDIVTEATYYNLQGLPVSHPTSGLYILRTHDGNSTKIYLK